MADCAHRKLQTWHFIDNGKEAGMWSCVGCGTKFVPITELLAAEREIERLQRIIDSRPAINAGLPQTYIDWSRGIYECDVLQACHAPKD